MPQGEYILQEIKAPDYYITDRNTYNFKITEDMQIVKLKLQNSPVICGFFNVSKTSNDSSIIQEKKDNTYLAGAKYEIRDKDNNLIYSGVTNENGKFENDLKLETGEYTINEIEAPEGYILDKTIYKFTILEKNGEKTIINLKNDVLEYKPRKDKETERKINVPKLPKTGY